MGIVGDHGHIGASWAGLCRAIANSKSKAVILAKADRVSTGTAERWGKVEHVSDTNLTALWQASESDLSESNADEGSGGDEGLHDEEDMKSRS